MSSDSSALSTSAHCAQSTRCRIKADRAKLGAFATVMSTCAPIALLCMDAARLMLATISFQNDEEAPPPHEVTNLLRQTESKPTGQMAVTASFERETYKVVLRLTIKTSEIGRVVATIAAHSSEVSYTTQSSQTYASGCPIHRLLPFRTPSWT